MVRTLKDVAMQVSFREGSISPKKLEKTLNELRAIPMEVDFGNYGFLNVELHEDGRTHISPDKAKALYCSRGNLGKYSLTYSEDSLIVRPNSSPNKYFFHTSPKPSK
jgi:hypothetical protein